MGTRGRETNVRGFGSMVASPGDGFRFLSNVSCRWLTRLCRVKVVARFWWHEREECIPREAFFLREKGLERKVFVATFLPAVFILRDTSGRFQTLLDRSMRPKCHRSNVLNGARVVASCWASVAWEEMTSPERRSIVCAMRWR